MIRRKAPEAPKTQEAQNQEAPTEHPGSTKEVPRKLVPQTQEAEAKKPEPRVVSLELCVKCGFCGEEKFAVLKSGEAVYLWCTKCNSRFPVKFLAGYRMCHEGDHRGEAVAAMLFPGSANEPRPVMGGNGHGSR